MLKLSICIPTYNRAQLLAATLHNLLAGLREHGLAEAIEVCVSDNGSNDGTADVIREIAAAHVNFRYAASDANQGFGRNLWRVVELATADYVLLTGDDDDMLVDRLPVVLDEIERSSPDLLLLDSAPAVPRSPADAGATDIAGLDTYLNSLGAFHGTFIGNLIFRRAAFLGVFQGEYIAASAYPHMIPVLTCLGHGKVRYREIALTAPTDEHRPWRALQPIYTAIDLARVFADFGLPQLRSGFVDRVRLATLLGRSLPRAWVRVARRQANIDPANPYQSVSLRNAFAIYWRLLFPRRAGEVRDARPDAAVGA